MPGSSGRGAPSPALCVFASATTVGLFLVVVLGFVDTATKSALGCGHSFPLCHGSLFPSDNLKAIIEWSHRALSAVVGLMVGATAVWAWVRSWRVIEVRVLGLIALGFVIVESVVGALAVLSTESQTAIATHMGIALTAFAAMALLAASLWTLRSDGALRRPAAPARVRAWTWAMFVYMYLAVYLGAYVAGTDSGVACLTWPLCATGRLTWSLGNPVTIDMLHRAMALLGGIVAVALMAAASRARAQRPDLARLAHAILGFLVVQVASGLLLVLTKIAIETTIIHVAIATAMFTTVAAMLLGVLPEARGVRAEPRRSTRQVNR